MRRKVQPVAARSWAAAGMLLLLVLAVFAADSFYLGAWKIVFRETGALGKLAVLAALRGRGEVDGG